MSNNYVPPSPSSAPSAKNADLMTVSVQDFGPIAQATVNLRPLTIFVGRSNTGKTYFSKLIYAIHKTFSGLPQIPFIRRHHFPFNFTEPTDPLISALKDYQQTENRHHEIRNLIFDFINRSLPKTNDQILEEIGQCFSTTNILTTRRLNSVKKNFKIKISYGTLSTETWNISVGSQRKKVSAESRFNPSAIEFFESPYEELISTIEQQVDLASSNSEESFLEYVSFEFSNFLLKLAYPDSGGYESSYFLPANRGGILESHKFVADVWLSQIPTLGLKHLPALQPLPKVSVDFIRTMLMIEGRSQLFLRRPKSSESRPLESVAKFIEDELIGGDGLLL